MPTTISAIRKTFHPLETAVVLAARQNTFVDFQKGLAEAEVFDQLPEEDKQKYLAEARQLLTSTGENRIPEYPFVSHICVEKTKTEVGS